MNGTFFEDSREIVREANEIALQFFEHRQWGRTERDAPILHALIQSVVNHVSKPLADACVEIGLLRARLDDAERELAELRKAHTWLYAKPEEP